MAYRTLTFQMTMSVVQGYFTYCNPFEMLLVIQLCGTVDTPSVWSLLADINLFADFIHNYQS